MLQLTTILFLISFSMLAAIHHIAIKLFLYWKLPWFDIPMHGFGGVIVALGFYTLRDLGLFPDEMLKPIQMVLLVLGVALLWEAFEFFIGIPRDANYIFDSSLDVLMGTLGGLVGYFVGKSIRSLH